MCHDPPIPPLCLHVLQTLRDRYEPFGVSLALLDAEGAVRQAAIDRSDLAAVLFGAESSFSQALRPLIADPAMHRRPHRICPGLWVIISPRLTRRRICGFFVALFGARQLGEQAEAVAALREWNIDPVAVRRLTDRIDEPDPEALRAIAASLAWSTEDLARLGAGAEEMRSLGSQLSDVYEELSLLHKVGENMNVATQPQRFMRLICGELLGVLPYRWVGVKLLEAENSSHQLAGTFIVAGELNSRLDTVESILTDYLIRTRLSAPRLIPNTGRDDNLRLRELGESLVIYPLMRGARVIGAVVACDKQGPDRQISSVDVKLIATTASQLQIFLENVGLYEDVQLMFLGTLEALSAAIDAKDRYTCGHSERVALLSRDLARAIGLPEDEVERIHISGIVHDIGKIGVPESVLCKPGRLTESEFSRMKEHPQIGARILRDIPHFDDIIPGVLYHHERFDGRGYPERLAGDRIPLFGRIIAIADSFDAMSSSRTYRAALTRTDALDEIHRCAGSQFDPKFARIFNTLSFDNYDAMTTAHRARYSGGSEAA